MDLTTQQPDQPPGDPVTHLNPDPTSRRSPGCHHRSVSLGLNGAVSLVPPLGTERWEGGGGEEDGGPLTGAAWVVVGGSRWAS
jgi:hypothetical protein